MAKRKLEFSLLALFDGRMALRALRRWGGRVSGMVRGMSRRAGLGAGFAGIGGGTGLGSMLGKRPGGVGGFLSGLTQGVASLALAPVRILSGFARLIPGVGGIIGSVVGSAANILQGLVGIAANVVGGIINAFGRMLTAVVGIFQKLVGAIGRVLGKITKVVAGVGLALGALMGWQMFKGIRENMRLADWRQVLGKVYGDAAKAAEEFARQLSLTTPFTPMQMIEAVAGLGMAELDYKRFMKTVVDWAAGAKRPLEEITMIFQRIRAGQFGEALEMARRGLISARDLRQAGIEFDKGGRALAEPMELIAALAKVVERRFGGMAEQAAEVGSGPLSTFVGVIQDLRMQLTGPWYDRFNDALKDMNKWFLALAETRLWKGIVAGSEAVARAVDNWIRGRAIPGVKALHEWLVTRDWSAAWKGLPERLKELTALLATKGEEGWEMGPLTQTVVAGVRYLKEQVLIVLEELWGAIGQRATETVAGVLKEISWNIAKNVEETQERYKREEIAAARKGKPSLPWTAGVYPPFAMTEAGRRERARQMAQRPPEEFVPTLAEPGIAAQQKIAGMLADTAGSILKLGHTAEGAEERIKGHAEAAQKAAKDISTAMEAVDAAILGKKIGEGEREPGILGGALPARSPEDLAAAQGTSALAGLRGTKEYKANEARIARKERMAELARQAGMLEDAARLEEEATAMREALDEFVKKILEDHVATKKELKRMNRLLMRVARARA